MAAWLIASVATALCAASVAGWLGEWRRRVSVEKRFSTLEAERADLLDRIQSPDLPGYRRRVALRVAGEAPEPPAPTTDLEEARQLAMAPRGLAWLPKGTTVHIPKDPSEPVVWGTPGGSGDMCSVPEFLRRSGRTPRNRVDNGVNE